ncbi:hypothetical protein Pan216_09450 [Planctomycetes bacterium Pan216]|uniref:DUF58 domain-containing protein n=1 Tax=Kolteria novifilia TaxID=2527975 RepID=A0A518AZB7_9BACT|nr:hypothetical protein Pan216_09450 [Planctomycetes bacterium Pan216]
MSLQASVQEEILERLGNVGVTARQAVESILSGRHRSVHRGLSVEFAGHRPYQPGDDLRHLDWKVFARTDRYDVRVYEEETRLRATIVVDCSGSMEYSSGGMTKLRYARMLAAALGFLMVRQKDAVGMVLCDTEIREHLLPSSRMSNLWAMLDHLESAKPGGETSLADVLDTLADRCARHGLIIIITDAFDEVDRLVQSLKHLRFRKQEIRLYQICDPHEETFPFGGMVEFVGMENEPRLRMDGDRIRSVYQEALAEHRRQLAEGCHDVGVQFEPCRTDDDLAMVLIRTLSHLAVGGQRR